MLSPRDSREVRRQLHVDDWRHHTTPQQHMLRVGITDRCNLRCAYCMPSTGVPQIGREQLPDLEELADLVAWVDRHCPLEKIKITGGEPLVRGGIVDFIRRVAQLPRHPEISMTTNATLLADRADDLRLAGLARVNVSLDTLDPQRYRQLTRGGRVQHVVNGLSAARDAGLFSDQDQRRTTSQQLAAGRARAARLRLRTGIRVALPRNSCEPEPSAHGANASSSPPTR